MNDKELNNLIQHIDAKYIEEAEFQKPAPINRRPLLIKTAVAAACFAVVSLIAITAFQGEIFDNGSLVSKGDDSQNASLPALVDSADGNKTEHTEAHGGVITNEKENQNNSQPNSVSNGVTQPQTDGSGELSGDGFVQTTPQRTYTTLAYIGTGFTQDEIDAMIAEATGEIVSAVLSQYGSDIKSITVCRKPYCHIRNDRGVINRDAITLAILVDGKISANYEVVRGDGETVKSTCFGGDKWRAYDDALTAASGEDVVFAYYGETAFELLILPNDSIITPIPDNSGASFEFTGQYQELKTPYNTLRLSDLENSTVIYSK